MGLGIILADDERSVRESIASLLSGAGYSVRTAKNGEMALALHRSEPCDLFVLDVMMPVMNGFEACTALRASGDGPPVVFLTALDGEKDVVEGLDTGGDDYVSKILPPGILLARLSAVARRIPAKDGDFGFGRWKVSPPKGVMTSPGGDTVSLTEREICMLRLLASSPGKIFSRDNLAARFWGMDSDVCDSSVYKAVDRLRQKFGKDSGLIECVYSMGVRYMPGETRK